MKVADLVEEAINRSGTSSVLAGEMGLEPKNITAMRGDAGRITNMHLDKMLEIAGYKIAPLTEEELFRKEKKELKTLLKGVMKQYLEDTE